MLCVCLSMFSCLLHFAKLSQICCWCTQKAMFIWWACIKYNKQVVTQAIPIGMGMKSAKPPHSWKHDKLVQITALNQIVIARKWMKYSTKYAFRSNSISRHPIEQHLLILFYEAINSNMNIKVSSFHIDSKFRLDSWLKSTFIDSAIYWMLCKLFFCIELETLHLRAVWWECE